MNEIRQSIINDLQTKCDLMEHGLVKVCGDHIQELAESAEAGTLTVEKIQLLNDQITTALNAFCATVKDAKETTKRFEAMEIEEAKKANGGTNADDNHK